MAVSWAAIVVAAGRGERFGRPKQFLELAGLPMVGWAIRTFVAMPEVSDTIVVTEPEWIDPMRELAARLAVDRAIRVVEGGASRQASARNGLQAVPERAAAAFVHDGARPLVRADDVRAGMREVREGRAALLAAPAFDTMKVVDPVSRAVVETLDRATLWAAQTPQFAMTADLVRAHERAHRDGVCATDDATLLELAGVEVVVVPASGENFKVTVPADLARAQAVLERRKSAAGLRA